MVFVKKTESLDLGAPPQILHDEANGPLEDWKFGEMANLESNFKSYRLLIDSGSAILLTSSRICGNSHFPLNLNSYAATFH